jgi:hypothetical protein
MKRFMFLSVGVLCLAIAALIGFYIGGQNAKAQSSVPVAGFSAAYYYSPGEVRCFVMQPNGDVYDRGTRETNDGIVFVNVPARLVGNYWEGAIATNKSTWGDVKEQYKK